MSRIFLFLLFFQVFVFGQAQNPKRNDLEKEKKENLRKIQETHKILTETRSQKTVNMGQLQAIQEQIRERSKVIRTIEKEARFIDESIYTTESNIKSLETNLVELRKEYALMIYTAYKTANTYDKLTFLFAAETFNQMVLRIKCFTYYSQSRKKQVIQIKKVSIALKAQRVLLYQQRNEKKSVLETQKIEQTNLEVLKKDQSTVVQELSKKEKVLQEELNERKKAQAKLEKLIRDLIKAEMKRSFDKNSSTPESSLLSNSFAGSKSKLFWPVRYGFISQGFGKQRHAVLKNVTIDNLGVDIQTNKDEMVRSVFDGKVAAVASVPGMHDVVMIQHGEYYTFYAKLKNVRVAVGQKVKAKEEIGQATTDQEEVSEVQFQIWKGNDKLDPEDWLFPR